MAANLTAYGPSGGVAFLTHPSAQDNNYSIDTAHDIAMGTELVDVGSNFASNTFTAPLGGYYQINVNIRFGTMDTDANYIEIRIVSSNRSYYTIMTPKFASDPTYMNMTWAGIVDMDASDTVSLSFYQSAGGAQTDLHTASWFSGFLVA